MNPLFVCSPPTALANIPKQLCPVRFDQICRFGFQLMQAVPLLPSYLKPHERRCWQKPMILRSSCSHSFQTLLFHLVRVFKEGGNNNTTINGIPRLKFQFLYGAIPTVHCKGMTFASKSISLVFSFCYMKLYK
jgi:hypothetical protein